MLARPNLTLAVIVKDEADLLAGLLDHHRDLYDEAVVVDTGSQDNSRSIALKAGAKLLDFPWNDDFAAARNHGLQESRGNWILQLDCDERIDPSDFANLLAIVSQPADHCRTLDIQNYTDSVIKGHDWCKTESKDRPWCGGAPGYWKSQPIRLFPNNPQFRYAGIIHESIVDARDQTALPYIPTPIVIHHTGLLSAEGRLRRERLYGHLLMKKVCQSPEDIRALTELARFMTGKNKLDVAERLLAKGLNSVPDPDKEIKANLLMIEIQTRLGKIDQAMIRVEKAVKNHPDQQLCWIQAVVLCLANRNHGKAQSYLKQGLKLFPQSPVLQQLEPKVQNGLSAKSASN